MQKLTFVRAARVLWGGGVPGLSVRIDISILRAPTEPFSCTPIVKSTLANLASWRLISPS